MPVMYTNLLGFTNLYCAYRLLNAEYYISIKKAALHMCVLLPTLHLFFSEQSDAISIQSHHFTSFINPNWQLSPSCTLKTSKHTLTDNQITDYRA